MKTVKRLWAWFKNYDAGLYCLALGLALAGCTTEPEDVTAPGQHSRTYHVRDMAGLRDPLMSGRDTIATADGLMYTFRTLVPFTACRAYVVDSALVEHEVLCHDFGADKPNAAIMRGYFQGVKAAMWVKIWWRVGE